ncbi:MAG: class B sortase [Clostridia bacterium]|nr:class B sortase [Clostridia bacterium]
MAKKKKKKTLPADPSAGNKIKVEEKPKKPDYNKYNESIAFSLQNMTPDMIELSPIIDPGAMLSQKRAEYMRRGMLLLFSLVFVFSLWSIVDTFIGYRQAEDIYGSLADSMLSLDSNSAFGSNLPDSVTVPFGTKISNTDAGTIDNALYERMKIRIAALKEQNPDICGWINIPGTKNVSYPILQASDNDYYLNRDYRGQNLNAGSIFLDYRCDRDFNGNHNTVIYGHNMQNGMMFSELISFLDESFFKENKYVYLYTEYGVYTYEIFAVYKTDYRYKYINTDFTSHEEFVNFAYEMKGNSRFVREGIEFDENSRIITLSTCTNGLRTDRYCIQALLVDAYNK